MAISRTGSEKIKLRMSSKGPKAVVLAAECLHSRALGHVPHTNTLVFRHRDDELLALVKDCAHDVVCVPSAGVDLPRLGFCIVQSRESRRSNVSQSILQISQACEFRG